MDYLKNKTVRTEILQGEVCMRKVLNVMRLCIDDDALCNNLQSLSLQKVLFCVAKDGKTHSEIRSNGLQNVPGWVAKDGVLL